MFIYRSVPVKDRHDHVGRRRRTSIELESAVASRNACHGSHRIQNAHSHSLNPAETPSERPHREEELEMRARTERPSSARKQNERRERERTQEEARRARQTHSAHTLQKPMLTDWGKDVDEMKWQSNQKRRLTGDVPLRSAPLSTVPSSPWIRRKQVVSPCQCTCTPYMSPAIARKKKSNVR